MPRCSISMRFLSKGFFDYKKVNLLFVLSASCFDIGSGDHVDVEDDVRGVCYLLRRVWRARSVRYEFGWPICGRTSSETQRNTNHILQPPPLFMHHSHF